jgi:hypothetical protein
MNYYRVISYSHLVLLTVQMLGCTGEEEMTADKETHKDTQTNKQTGRQADRQTDSKTGRQ